MKWPKNQVYCWTTSSALQLQQECRCVPIFAMAGRCSVESLQKRGNVHINIQIYDT